MKRLFIAEKQASVVRLLPDLVMVKKVMALNNQKGATACFKNMR